MNQPSKLTIASGVLLVVLLVSGCSQLRNITGKGKNPPDEFAVIERPSLVVPPEYDLAPPDPGKPSPQDLASASDTLRALFPDQDNVVPKASKGEVALLKDIEASPVPEVRSEVDDLDTQVVEKGTLLDEIIQEEERNGSVDDSDISHVSSEKETDQGKKK